MRFLINTTNLQHGGALQVALNLLSEWNAMNVPHEFRVLLSPQLNQRVDRAQFAGNFTFHDFPVNPTHSIIHVLSFHRLLRQQENHFRPDIVFTVFGPALWKPRALHIEGFANGYYLFDDSAFIRKHVLSHTWLRAKYYIRRRLILYALNREADSYWVETNMAQQKLSQALRKPLADISVAGNTYGYTFENTATTPSSQNNRFTLLYLSAYYAHKNFEILPGLIRILQERNIHCRFLLTLPDPIFKRLFPGEKTREYIHNTGPVAPTDAAALYREADAAFLPSLLETFSANYPEAMKMKKPILCSDLEFARNICGDAALYFDPENAADIADKIATLIQDTGLRQQLIEAGIRKLQELETPRSRATKIMDILVRSFFKNNEACVV